MRGAHPDAPPDGMGNPSGWEIDVHADYAFRVKGRLTPALRVALDPLEATDASAETLRVGRGDRAALHGLVARVEALGLELVGLQQLPSTDGGGDHECPTCGRGRGADATRASPTA